jgi:hypothetical protein
VLLAVILFPDEHTPRRIRPHPGIPGCAATAL